jgi:hypothetical protein
MYNRRCVLAISCVSIWKICSFFCMDISLATHAYLGRRMPLVIPCALVSDTYTALFQLMKVGWWRLCIWQMNVSSVILCYVPDEREDITDLWRSLYSWNS